MDKEALEISIEYLIVPVRPADLAHALTFSLKIAPLVSLRENVRSIRTTTDLVADGFPITCNIIHHAQTLQEVG